MQEHKTIRKDTRVYDHFDGAGKWYLLGTMTKVKKNGKFDVHFDDDTTETNFA